MYGSVDLSNCGTAGLGGLQQQRNHARLLAFVMRYSGVQAA
jgi:hypothetical protein